MEGDLDPIAEAPILLAQTAQTAQMVKEAGPLQEGLEKTQELTRITREMPSPPPTLPAALWAAVMGIKRAEPIIKKVSFYLLTKKVYSYKGQPVELVLWQGSYNDNV